ncbi:hypothetical protein [Dokdonia sp.]|uniref:hypothetical protein n=1 Tax=Dokdonia sp. TaxID=2024995 RepID=UPI00326640AD
MSTSIIRYNDKYIDPNDFILILGLSLFKESVRNKGVLLWFENYLKDIIDPIIDIKPVGWVTLSLEDNLNSKERRIYLIKLLDDSIKYIKENYEEQINATQINRLMKLEGREKRPEKAFITRINITDVLEDIILLLNDDIIEDHPRMNIYEKN